MKCAFIDLGKHFGGAENYLLVLIKNWIDMGNEAIVLAKRGSRFEQSVKESSIKAQIYGVDFSYCDVKNVRKMLLSENVDILNINGINSGLFVLLMNTKIRCITTVHSNADIDRSNYPHFIRKAFVVLENYCLHRSEKVIVVSKAIEKLLLDRGIEKSKIHLIQNGVKEIVYPQKHLRENEQESLRICYVGRLEKVKGCEYLIRALQRLEEVDYICDIYGEGSILNELKELALKCGNKIQFMGFSKNIREKLIQYDVIVLPSLYEAFPLTIPEAMNAKVLLVCSNVGGIPYIIDDSKNGYLFEKKNVEQLVNILTKIAKNPTQQIQIVNQAYNDFKDFYTEDVMIKNTTIVLEGR